MGLFSNLSNSPVIHIEYVINQNLDVVRSVDRDVDGFWFRCCYVFKEPVTLLFEMCEDGDLVCSWYENVCRFVVLEYYDVFVDCRLSVDSALEDVQLLFLCDVQNFKFGLKR